MKQLLRSIITVVGTLLCSLIVTFKITHLVVGHPDLSYWWIPVILTVFVIIGECARYRAATHKAADVDIDYSVSDEQVR